MNHARLLTLVNSTIEQLQGSDPSARDLAEAVITNLGDELGLNGARLYERTPQGWELIASFGASRSVELGLTIPASYPVFQRLLQTGLVVMDAADSETDAGLESKLGVERFAAIVIADEKFVLSFDVEGATPADELSQALGIIRHAMNQNLRADRYLSIIEQSRVIQQSILPLDPPTFPGFEIAGKTCAAEYVSGDYYSFLPLSDKALGLTVADATGHGLPAALVVRDIHMGLRMGSDRDFKIVRTVEKLNQIIHSSQVTTKFVSLFYGELESSGALIYVNAGHLPPIHWSRSGVRLLRPTGMVLGPSADASYARGFTFLEEGDVLCLYTDGIVEAPNGEDEELGQDRLIAILESVSDRPAHEIVAEVLEETRRWTGAGAPDDRTVVAIRRVPTEMRV